LENQIAKNSILKVLEYNILYPSSSILTIDINMNSQAPIFSVTQLNRQIRTWLEQEIGSVYVQGEVSTLSCPASGHYYFTLKDATAQIKCVFFRNRHTQSTSTTLLAGQQIVIFGQLSLYEARGDYQLIVEHIENAGLGDLYRQFELLKTKLAALGLFEASRKKKLPLFPRTIGIITSSSAAALKDILSTIKRRYPVAEVILYPSDVQGKQAPLQLIKALSKANQEKHCDVIILARGGGSIEDLWAFNDEHLALAIANSEIPIVSGIGHETDFTIADFVADLRAATPTAAAEAVTPNQIELIALLRNLYSRMMNAIKRLIKHKQLLLEYRLQKLISPNQLIRSHWQSLDYIRNQLITAFQQQFSQKQHRLEMLSLQLNSLHPSQSIQQSKQQLEYLVTQLIQQINRVYQTHQQTFSRLINTLHVVSPLSTLERGYAIATHNHHILSNKNQVKPGDLINLRLANGQLTCEVLDDTR